MRLYECLYLLLSALVVWVVWRDLKQSASRRLLKWVPADLVRLVAISLVAVILIPTYGVLLVPHFDLQEVGGLSSWALIRLLAWHLFFVTPLLALLLAWHNRRTATRLASLEVVMALGIWGIAVQCFLVEPQALEVTHYTLVSDKLSRSYTVAVLADIQTDSVGDYEQRALRLALEEQPDLLVLPGDYVQAYPEEHEAQQRAFLELFRQEEVQAPLGVFAVQGDMEWGWDWSVLFEPVVQLFGSTRTQSINEEITMTGLVLTDSKNPYFSLYEPPSEEQFHILVGHSPDFVLGGVAGDLVLAGHTHGGQVQLPFFGPPLTFSQLPRDWTSGRTELPSGGTLIVSRGIGMERGEAPRLRFLCRPEVVILHLEPETASARTSLGTDDRES